MRKTLLTYVKPHVQEDPVSQVLGITYLAAVLERENLPVEIVGCRFEGGFAGMGAGLRSPAINNQSLVTRAGTSEGSPDSGH